MNKLPRLTMGRRLILQFLTENGARARKTCLMKWLFLLANETEWGLDNSPYDFLPYKYGAFSFVAYRDIQKLVDAKLVGEGISGIETASGLRTSLSLGTKMAVREIVRKYGGWSHEDLLTYTYREYPWFSLLSERSDLVEAAISKPAAQLAIYTLGYSGKSIDSVLNLLLRKGLAGVADVRATPLSRRYGFHGNTLSRYLQRVGLSYSSYPALGIASDERKNSQSALARKELFAAYRKRITESEMPLVRAVAEKLTAPPFALLCLEADPSECHRSVLADIITDISELEVCHL